MKHKYYTMQKQDDRCEVLIYGDITSWPVLESDVSGWNFVEELKQMGDVREIDVRINSYGGEVSEGFAIYNALKSNSAHVRTTCDGFACSAASVIFMAGDERIMHPLSALWIHNVQTVAAGDSAELRKAAEESEKLTELSRRAYTDAGLNISEEILQEMMNAETWIMPEEAVAMGFATAIGEEKTSDVPEQSAIRSLFKLIRQAAEPPKAAQQPPEEEELPETEEPTGEPEKKLSDHMLGFLHMLTNVD